MTRRFLAILLISAFVVILPHIAIALSPQQVDQIARQVTVLIDGYQSGSGVIFKRNGNVYNVLTAKHVVSAEDVIYLVITPNGERHQTEATNVQPINGVDLAVVQFTTDKIYPVAQLGNSDQVASNSTVYVAGAPEPNQTMPQRTLIVSPGNIVGVQKPQNGYALIYTNPTRRGMSGGPVLNEAGQVIGIHGNGDEQDGSKTGLNLGIPIKTFLVSPLGSLITSQAPQNVSPVVPSKQTDIVATPSPTKQPTEEQKRKAAELKNDLEVQDENWLIFTAIAIVVARWLAVIWCILCILCIIGSISMLIENNFNDFFLTLFVSIIFSIPGFWVLWYLWDK
jgi:Trypsin-like peptidase domain